MESTWDVWGFPLQAMAHGNPVQNYYQVFIIMKFLNNPTFSFYRTFETDPPPEHELNSKEREFFSLVTSAIFANPFSDERIDIDMQLAGLYPVADSASLDRIEKIREELTTRLAVLEENNKAHVTKYAGKDRFLIENAFVFDFFYRYRGKFDELINQRFSDEDAPIKIPFAKEAILYLRKKGFEDDSISRYFALCYQLRRAYYFIGHNLVGCSPCMKGLRRNLWNNIFTHNIGLYDRYLWDRMEDFSTLILGETGTGKGTAAMAIGRSGFIPFDIRRHKFVESFMSSFISLNLSQFPETLIESELFGHKKGSFTGAVEDHKGVFDRCTPFGAIFLDEIGEVASPIQIKLLQVIQERVFCPVGSHVPNRFQGRVIAATNRGLPEIREKGVLRDDFFYRLCSDIITVPPLRIRIQEDPVELDELLAHTVERMIGKPSQELVDMVRSVIDKQLGIDYPWPGNVRELEQCVRRVLLKRNYEGSYKAAATSLDSMLKDGVTTGSIDAQGLITGYCYLLYKRHGTFEEVARLTNLDRRTVKKYINEWIESGAED